MRHLFSSRVEVLRLSGTLLDGTPTLSWAKITEVCDPFLGVPGEMLCRIDPVFLRPGKDQPAAPVAGRAPDTTAILYFSNTDKVKAGDRIRALAGPVAGTWELRLSPDTQLDFNSGHHLEVQIVEVAQALAGVFPAAEPQP